MNTYIIFLYGDFDDFQDMEFFCLNVLGDSKKVNEVKYIIQNLNSIIVILDSNSDKNSLHEELSELLENPNVNYYFIFEKRHIFMVHLPEKIQEIIFKPKPKIDNDLIIQVKSLDLDEILDKIDKHGVESLTEIEKKFLDNFGL